MVGIMSRGKPAPALERPANMLPHGPTELKVPPLLCPKRGDLGPFA